LYDSKSHACFTFFMTDKANSSPDLAALAEEALDLWQGYLASYAADAKGKAELMQIMEPSRRLFAEWATLMQHGAYADFLGKHGQPGGAGSGKAGAYRSHETGGAARAEAFRTADDGSAELVAQLTRRVAELEEKLARFESGAAKPPRPSARAHRPKSKS
jgi:hypothetical protein